MVGRRELSFMASRLYAFSALTFVLACVIFAFVGNVDNANDKCLVKWIDEVRKLSKQVHKFVKAAAAIVSDDQGVPDRVSRLDFFEQWESNLVVASTVSDCVAAAGIIYAFLLFFNAVFNFATLSLSANWQLSKVIKYQFHINVFGSVLALVSLVLTSVYCHYVSLNLLVLEGFEMKYSEDSATIECLSLLNDLQGKWCPVLIVFSAILVALHCYIAKIARNFDDGLSPAKSRSTFSSGSSSPNRLSKVRAAGDSKAALKAEEDRKFSLLNVKNLVVGGAARSTIGGGGGGNSTDRGDGRTRLPSSRNYPSSPILPVAHDDIERGDADEPLGHSPSAPLF